MEDIERQLSIIRQELTHVRGKLEGLTDVQIGVDKLHRELAEVLSELRLLRRDVRAKP